MLLGFVFDIVFSVFVTLLMLKMKVPTKTGYAGLLHNGAFWVYVGYWVKTCLTIVRLYLWYDGVVHHELITLTFNCTGSLLVSLSSISPMQLYLHYQMKGSFTHVPHKNRLWYCLGVATLYLSVYGLTLSMIASDITTTSKALLVWRCWFFLNAFVESFFLVCCLMFIARNTKHSKPLHSLRRHLLITLYMRIGICGTIILKIAYLLPAQVLGVLHLWFIFTGLLGYHLRAVQITHNPCAQLTKILLIRSNQILVYNEEDDQRNRVSHAGNMTPAEENRAEVTWAKSPRDWRDDGVSIVPRDMVVV